MSPLDGCVSPVYSPDSPQLSAVVDGTSVTLTWNVPNDGGAALDKYVLYGVVSSFGQSWIKISDIMTDVRNGVFACNKSLSCSATTSTGTGNTITAEITGLAPNKSYGFKVFAKNHVGASGSNTAWITTGLPAAPNPPRNLAAGIMDSEITLTWDVPSSNGSSPITEYVIASRMGTVNPFSVAKTMPSSETSVTIDTVNGMPYQFVAYAKNNTSTSSASNMVEAVSVSPPAAPTNITSMIDSNKLVLSWTAPESSAAAPVDHYEINVAVSGLDNFFKLYTDMPTDTTYAVNYYPGASYAVTIYAVNDAGKSQMAEYNYDTEQNSDN